MHAVERRRPSETSGRPGTARRRGLREWKRGAGEGVRGPKLPRGLRRRVQNRETEEGL